MHHEDLTPGVLAGLAWYYLLAAALNAAAAAYLSYGEMVSEGASREGLLPKTRRFPAWLIATFFGLYGLAIVMILARQFLPGAVTAAYIVCGVANMVLAVLAGADAAHFAEARAEGHGEGLASNPRVSTTTSRPSAWASRSIARSGP